MKNAIRFFILLFLVASSISCAEFLPIVSAITGDPRVEPDDEKSYLQLYDKYLGKNYYLFLDHEITYDDLFVLSNHPQYKLEKINVSTLCGRIEETIFIFRNIETNENRKIPIKVNDLNINSPFFSPSQQVELPRPEKYFVYIGNSIPGRMGFFDVNAVNRVVAEWKKENQQFSDNHGQIKSQDGDFSLYIPVDGNNQYLIKNKALISDLESKIEKLPVSINFVCTNTNYHDFARWMVSNYTYLPKLDKDIEAVYIDSAQKGDYVIIIQWFPNRMQLTVMSDDYFRTYYSNTTI